MTSNNELRVVSIDGSTFFKYILTDKNEKQWFLGSPAWNRDGSVLAVGARFGRIILFDTQTWTLSLIAFTNCGCGAVSPHFSPDDKVVGAGSFLIRSPEGIVQATLNASADVRMGQQFRDQWLARIEPLCQSGQLTASACYKARTAIEEGHTSEYPDLLAFLLNEISLEEFLKRFNG